MKRFFALAWLMTVLSLPAFAVEPNEMLKDPAMEARALALTRDMRCPVCMGQDVDGSAAPLAADIRRTVRDLVREGATDAQIYDFIRARYGDGAIMTPLKEGRTRVLWWTPFGVLAAGLISAVFFIRRQNRGG